MRLASHDVLMPLSAIAQHVTVGVEGAFQIAREAARGLVGVPPGGTINLSTGNGAIRMSLFYIGAQADTTQGTSYLSIWSPCGVDRSRIDIKAISQQISRD